MIRKTNSSLNKRLDKIIVRRGNHETLILVTVGTADRKNITVKHGDIIHEFDTYKKFTNYLNKIEATHVILDLFKDDYDEGTPIARVVDS